MVNVIGHRGAAGLEPENTLRSFKKALALGVDQVELDVHLSKDGVLAVIHDDTVDRTTNGRGSVKDLTINEIKELDAGQGERIPTLQEVIDLVAEQAILQIELKGLGVEESVVQIVEENDLINRVILTSFRHYMVKKVKTLNSCIETGVLFMGIPLNAPRLCLDANAEGLHPHVKYVDAHLVQSAHRFGLKVRVWTTDDIEEMQQLLTLGVDAICTNRPDLLVNLLQSGTLS